MAWGQPPVVQPVPQGQPPVPQQGVPQPGFAPQPGQVPQPQGQPQGPQFEQPHPTVQYGQNLPPQAPQQAPVAQPQGGPTVQMDPRSILDGPGVPPELRGKTFGQAMRIYGALANNWLQQQQGRPPEQSARDLAGQPQGGQQPPPQQQLPAGGQPSAAANFFRDPAGVIAPIVEQTVQRIVGPVLQQTRGNAIEQARDRARAMVPDWQGLEADIMETVATATPDMLTNPEYWIGAADLARGKSMRVRNPNPLPTPQGPAQQQAQQPMAPFYGPQAVPTNGYGFQQPAYPPNSFTEAPSAPSIYSNTPMGVLSPAEQTVAQKMGMSFEQYAAWKGGVYRGR